MKKISKAKYFAIIGAAAIGTAIFSSSAGAVSVTNIDEFITNLGEGSATKGANNEVILQKDVFLDNAIMLESSSPKSYTLNLNNHNIDATDNAITVKNNVSLTINGNGKFFADDGFVLSVYGLLTINSGNYESRDDVLRTWSQNAKIIINGGEFKSQRDSISKISIGSYEINGGNFMTNNKSTLIVTSQDTHEEHNSNITINGGTFTSTASSAIMYDKYNSEGIDDPGVIPLTITGGIFKGGIAGLINDVTDTSFTNISGGTFRLLAAPEGVDLSKRGAIQLLNDEDDPEEILSLLADGYEFRPGEIEQRGAYSILKGDSITVKAIGAPDDETNDNTETDNGSETDNDSETENGNESNTDSETEDKEKPDNSQNNIEDDKDKDLGQDDEIVSGNETNTDKADKNKPSTSAKKDKVKNPNTGDSTNILIPISLVSIIPATLIITYLVKRKA